MHMSVAQAYAILEHSSVVELPAYIRRVPGSIPGVPIFQNGGATMISEFVEYVKQVWKNKPNVSSPLNADRMNHMEAGIENNSKKIKETVTAVNELTENKANKDHSHAWSAITGKPSSFTPASHTHDDRYFTESEINNKLKDLVITKDFTSSKVTVAAQSAKQVAISFNVPSGYKMLNNVIVKTNGAVLLSYFAQRDGSVLTCYMYNFTNASSTCTLTATVPFIKS